MAEPSWTSGHGASLLWYCQIFPSFLPELSLGALREEAPSQCVSIAHPELVHPQVFMPLQKFEVSFL